MVILFHAQLVAYNFKNKMGGGKAVLSNALVQMKKEKVYKKIIQTRHLAVFLC